jgi:hypothetical protein
MTFNVEIVLRGRDYAVTEAVSIPFGEPSTWTEDAVHAALVEVLRAINRAEHPDAPSDQAVVLRGFSWIVEPAEGQVIIAIEIPMGAAVAGPLQVGQVELDALITRVLANDRQLHTPVTVH